MAAVLAQGVVDVVADQAGDHVHDVVPVVTEAGEPPDGLPGLRRGVAQQLIGDDLVQHDVQPRVDWLTGHDNLFIAIEGICPFGMHGLKQDCAVVLIGKIQPFQLYALVSAVPLRHRPRPAVTGYRVIEPAVCFLVVTELQRRLCRDGPDNAARLGAACCAAGLLSGSATAGRTSPAFRAHDTDYAECAALSRAGSMISKT
jgi:hypothetical protein